MSQYGKAYNIELVTNGKETYIADIESKPIDNEYFLKSKEDNITTLNEDEFGFLNRNSQIDTKVKILSETLKKKEAAKNLPPLLSTDTIGQSIPNEETSFISTDTVPTGVNEQYINPPPLQPKPLSSELQYYNLHGGKSNYKKRKSLKITKSKKYRGGYRIRKSSKRSRK
jgi:hypothetical protein